MVFRAIFFVFASMAISFIAATIQYWHDNHAIVKFEIFVMTPDVFLVGSAVSGLLLSFM